MPAILSEKTKKALSDPVSGVVTRFERVEQYWNPAVQNMTENWKFYWGLYPHLGQGQWPVSSIPKMVQSGRQLTQYNFILPIIDSLHEVILKMPFEPEFIPLDETGKNLTEIAKHMMHSDRELMDWDSAFSKFVLFGLIFEGVMKMVVSDRYDPLGNIGFENCAQGSVFFDPFWKTGNRKDLKRVYKKSWMSAEDIYRVYGNERALMDAKNNRMHGEEYGPFLGINPYESTSALWGSMHQVYEEYYMMPITKVSEIIVGPEGEMEMPDIPDEDKPDYLDHFLPGWDKTSVYEEHYQVEECHLKTACPAMAGQQLLVDSEKIEVQVGSPPFFKWAANFENGQSRGMVDSLKDPQTNQNFLEAEIIRKIQSEGGGGGKYVDDSLFLTPKEADRFHKYSNRPDMKFRVKPGTLRKGLTPSAPVETTGVPATFYENIRHIQNEIVPVISKRPPVSMGRTEKGTDPSGKIFEFMGIEADNQIGTLVRGMRYCCNDIYEAYLLQAGQTYSNEMIPRQFTYKKKTLTANNPVGMNDLGMVIENDVRGLMKIRHKIIINERQASPSDKANTANQLINYAKTIRPENIGTLAVINNEIIKNIETFNDDVLAELEEMSSLEKDVAMAKLKLEKLSTEKQIKMLEMEMNPPAQAAPAMPGSASPAVPTYELPSPQNNAPPQPAAAETINQEVAQ